MGAVLCHPVTIKSITSTRVKSNGSSRFLLTSSCYSQVTTYITLVISKHSLGSTFFRSTQAVPKPYLSYTQVLPKP